MGRRRGHKRTSNKGYEGKSVVEDTDDVYDEVDLHNNTLTEGLDRPSKLRKTCETEVLSVNADGLDDLYEDGDLDKPEDDPLLNYKIASANEWGKSRRDYYVNNKTRVREDGNLNEEEIEALELEEEDAVQRQHKLDNTNSIINFDQFFMDEVDQVTEATPIKKLSLREKLAIEAAKHTAAETKAVPEKKTDTGNENRKTVSKVKNNQKTDFVEGWDDPEEVAADDEEKRGITYEIEKNKGILQKRKKGTEHSRIKRRVQYKKALVKRRSQVPDVRRETERYGGEARGIRASTVRSIKIKA